MKTLVMDFAPPQDDVRSRTLALVITLFTAALILALLIFIKILVPNPPLPPSPEKMEIEFFDLEIGGGTGENSANPGGASLGNSGEAGSEAAEQPIPNPNPAPSNGAVTSDEADNPPANPTPQPSAALQNALAAFNKGKGKATINVTGGGQGTDPYGGGIGGKGGNGEGPGENSPGDGGPGQGGSGGTGKGVRKLLSKPDVKNPTLEEGVVAVDVYVDKSGKVVRAEVNSARSTTINTILRATARQEATKLVFSADASGSNQMLLTIEFNFTLK
jgi:periplasmic protein TonB